MAEYLNRRGLLLAAGSATVTTLLADNRLLAAPATPAASPVPRAEDERFMRLALDEARQGISRSAPSSSAMAR